MQADTCACTHTHMCIYIYIYLYKWLLVCLGSADCLVAWATRAATLAAVAVAAVARHEASWPLNFFFPAVYYKLLFVYKWNENEKRRVKMRKPARTTAKWLNVNFFFCYIFYVMLEHAISKASAAQSRQLFWFPFSPFSFSISFQVITYGFCTSFARCAIVALAPIAKKRKWKKRHALWAGLSSSCSLPLTLIKRWSSHGGTHIFIASVCVCVLASDR